VHRAAVFLAAAVVLRAAGVVTLDDCAVSGVDHGGILLHCRGDAAVRIQAITPDMIRVRASATGKFSESLPVRFGFVRDNWPAVAIRTRTTRETVWLETSSLRVKAGLHPFRLSVLDRSGRLVFEERDAVELNADGGYMQRIAMARDEHFYGLGFQRMALDVRGHKLQWWRTFRSSEATVPFLLSIRGYGLYSNNTYRHVFDLAGSPDSYSIAADGEELDYYLIHGPAFRDILNRYTELTGRPMLAPRWALGVGYESRYFEDQKGVLKTAAGFRREDVPLDWIGLEPGWEDVPYSMKWKWSPARFPDPDAMIRDLAALGIKMGLWESGDAPKTGFADEEVRKAWYRPRIEAAIDKGIRFFKQDDPYPRMINSQEMLPAQPNSALEGSGVLTAAQLNNLSNSLYSDTAFREYRRVTGERAMIMFNGYNSSISSQRWPFTWEADFPLGVGALSASLSGHSLVSTRDRNEAPDGIHLGYLAPFCYLESWAYYKEPWLYSETLLDMNRFYAKLRYRLFPYLYSSLDQSAQSGLPVMRPMVLEFQNDPETYLLASQFMLGDWLLVGSAGSTLTSGAEQPKPVDGAPAEKAQPRIYLPKGRWYDFWTGDSFESKGEWHSAKWPATAGGPLWVRGGAIVPMGPVTAYIGQEPLEVLRLDIYPSGSSHYTAYEDDGRTYDYEKGAYAKTEFRCAEKPGTLAISIGPRRGSYSWMPRHRGYLLGVHTKRFPTSVTAAGAQLRQVASKAELLYSPQSKGWNYESDPGILWIKPSPGWHYDYDARGAAGDPDRDTAYWNAGAGLGDGGMEIAVSLVPPPAPAKPIFGPSASLGLEPSDRVLLADATSTSRLTVTVVDASGRRVYDARTAVRIEAHGEAALGCGAPACQISAIDGVATTVLTSKRAAGNVRIRATAPGLAPAESTVEIVRGVIELKASPPERIKLNSDGAWLPLRVNLYATIRAGGVRLKSADTVLHLHVTGGSGKTPDDRESKAVEGIAVFQNIFFEKPPNYVLHVTGEGLEPAQIPIY
jgi:alpha-glucosidase